MDSHPYKDMHDENLYKNNMDSHPTKNFSKVTLFDTFCMLYVDDGAFAFVTRRDLEIGAQVVHKQFERLGLEMHVGNANKA